MAVSERVAELYGEYAGRIILQPRYPASWPETLKPIAPMAMGDPKRIYFKTPYPLIGTDYKSWPPYSVYIIPFYGARLYFLTVVMNEDAQRIFGDYVTDLVIQANQIGVLLERRVRAGTPLTPEIVVENVIKPSHDAKEWLMVGRVGGYLDCLRQYLEELTRKREGIMVPSFVYYIHTYITRHFERIRPLGRSMTKAMFRYWVRESLTRPIKKVEDILKEGEAAPSKGVEPEKTPAWRPASHGFYRCLRCGKLVPPQYIAWHKCSSSVASAT